MKTLSARPTSKESEPRDTPVRREGAEVLPVPPPLFYVIPMAVGLAINRVVPFSFDAPGSRAAGVILLAAGVGIAAAGAVTLARHHTTLVPQHAVSTLVAGGIYRFTRNPMYAGLGLAYLGGSLLARSWWPLALLVPALLVIRRFVIDPEEHYLAAQFGVRYDDYRSRVRRWM